MNLGKIFLIFEGGVHSATRGVRYISIVTLFLMMLLITTDVIGRYLFSMPVKGAMEIDEMMMTIIVFLSLAYCTVMKRHIIVEVVLYRLPVSVQIILSSVSSLAGAVIIAIIARQTFLNGWDELFSPTGTITMMLRIPAAPFLFVAFIGFVLMFLELLIEAIHSIAGLINIQDNV